MDFGYVLKRAWEIIWKFKVLWVFGILASCGQASGSSGGNSGYRFSAHENGFTNQIQQYFSRLGTTEIAVLIAVGIVVILVLLVLAILLGTVGRVGLIRGTLKAEQGATRLTFGELWRDGLTYFWRVFGLNLLVGVILFLAFLVIFVPSAILTGLTVGVFALCLIPIICLLVPVMWAVSVVIEQANIALVVENLGITAAIQRGWQVVKDNLGNMLLMSLILLLGVGLIGGAIVGLPLLAVAAPAIAGFASGTSDAIRNGLIISAVLFVVYLPFLLLFSGILRSYTSTAWTLTYLRLTAPRASQPLIEPPVAPAPQEPPQSPSIEIS